MTARQLSVLVSLAGRLGAELPDHRRLQPLDVPAATSSPARSSDTVSVLFGQRPGLHSASYPAGGRPTALPGAI